MKATGIPPGRLPFVVLVFVAGIGGGLGLRLWGSQQASAVVGPNQVEVLEGGRLVVAAGDHFYVHDQKGALLQRVAADSLGSPAYVGPILALDADQVLLRDDRRMDDRMEARLRAFARRREPEQSSLQHDGPGVLQRCRLSTGQCEPFGEGPDAFHQRRVFGLARDPVGKRVFVTDTSAWQLLELDPAGRIARVASTALAFPNDLHWVDGELWVADTNHHRLVRVDAGDAFGDVLETIPLAAADVGGFNWPVAFDRWPGGGWVVVASNRAFSSSRVFLIAADGAVRPLDTPAEDLLDVARVGQTVFLADFRGFALWAVDVDGERSQPWGSPRFLDDMAALKRDRVTYQWLSWSGLGVLGLAFVYLLAVYLRVD